MLYRETIDATPYWVPRRTPVLFIHGLGVDHTVWLEQVVPFAKQRPVILVDTRGHGRSPMVEGADYSIAAHAADIAAVIGDEPVHLVGTSMGGLIAQQVTVRTPHLVRGLVLAGTFCTPPAAANLATLLPRLDAAPTMDAFFRPIVLGGSGKGQPARVVERSVGLGSHIPRAVLRAGYVATFGYDDPATAEAITKPTLVIVGEDDTLRPETQQLAARIRGARSQVIAAAGHTPYRQRPHAFNALVMSFLDEVDAS